MKSIRCLNRGFIPFAMVASAKQLLTGILFACMLFLSPSLRADIVYSNLTGGNQFSLGSNTGNTFTTGSSASTIKSISLYLSQETRYFSFFPWEPPMTITASGLMRIDLYRASNTPNASGVYDWDPSYGHLADSATVDISTISFSGGMVTFDFSGRSGINLDANTRYSFMTGFDASNYDLVYAYGKNGTTSGGSTIGTQNLIIDGIGQTQSIYGTVEVETTAVPEPGTLILTGSALLAGAIGVYFTRRHRDQALALAAV
jgi:hypothetical protein